MPHAPRISDPQDADASSAGVGAFGPRPGEDVLEFDIPSDLRSGRDVQDAVLRACREVGFDDDAYFAVKLALDEAVTNAIKHGNKMDAAKRVHVRAAVDAVRLWIEIRDEGPGFRREHVPDPTLDENLHKCGGRGLLLIEAYMSDVMWSADGRSIRMTKFNRPEAPSLAS